ncbi:WAT1-related protein At4g30420-like isoform X2 [Ziziphus jujuba]|uniref:WAT1-related protein n=1 Tax=Ziziphus jujuba TaxID=326968 RepID=A0A6P3ZVS0_ZIZJJ|nr:WAT1-related protein At4g30420-like isoform X2 [Ziziphus jujuba]
MHYSDNHIIYTYVIFKNNSNLKSHHFHCSTLWFPHKVKMSRWDGYKPAMAMIGLQCIYAGLALFTRAALLQGMSPRVFVVYRRDPRRRPFGLRSFYLIFVSSLIGVTGNQNAYFEGLFLSSSTIATAMTNLMPAITFVMAATAGMEKVNPRSFSSIAKIIGTVLCVGGAVSMALLKGPKLLNTQFLPSDSLFGNGGENLQLGCLFLFGSSCFWSFWIIMQVEISESCPDHFYSSIWICFLSSFQSAIFAVFIDHDFEAWQLNSVLEIGSCIYAGLATAVTFYVQAWCISKRGPLFCAMFNPLCTVITTIIAACFLHENLYVESLVGAFAVIVGLYVVLWGKAKDLEDSKRDTNPTLPCQEEIKNIHVLVDESSDKTNGKIDLEERLLAHQSNQTTLAD